MVGRSYAPVGDTPILKQRLTRDHLSAMSAITLDGRLYILEQERAFKGDDVVRFLKRTSCARSLESCSSYGMVHRSIGEGRSKIFWRAERLAGCNWSSCPATHQISTL